MTDIPEDILRAARKVDLWFKSQGIKEWKLMGIQSRDNIAWCANDRRWQFCDTLSVDSREDNEHG